jgi:hypothetical protein
MGRFFHFSAKLRKGGKKKTKSNIIHRKRNKEGGTGDGLEGMAKFFSGASVPGEKGLPDLWAEKDGSLP